MDTDGPSSDLRPATPQLCDPGHGLHFLEPQFPHLEKGPELTFVGYCKSHGAHLCEVMAEPRLALNCPRLFQPLRAGSLLLQVAGPQRVLHATTPSASPLADVALLTLCFS